MLYPPLAQVEELDAHHQAVHMPLAATIPGLVRAEIWVVVGTPDGSPVPDHRIAELYFKDADGSSGLTPAGPSRTPSAPRRCSRPAAGRSAAR